MVNIADQIAIHKGQAAAASAWTKLGKAIVIRPAIYLKAIAGLAKATNNSLIARQAFDRELLRLAADSRGIFTSRLSQITREVGNDHF